MSGWYLAPGTYAGRVKQLCSGHIAGTSDIAFDGEGWVNYAVRRCRHCCYGREDHGGRKLLEPGSLRLRRAAEEVPEAPADLGATGHAFWERIWSNCDWISPVAEYEAVAEAARLMDDQEIARCLATRTAEPRDLRVVIALSRALSSSLARLGFNLEARLELGVRPPPRPDQVVSWLACTE